jgi:hypothetical protein
VAAGDEIGPEDKDNQCNGKYFFWAHVHRFLYDSVTRSWDYGYVKYLFMVLAGKKHWVAESMNTKQIQIHLVLKASVWVAAGHHPVTIAHACWAAPSGFFWLPVFLSICGDIFD